MLSVELHGGGLHHHATCSDHRMVFVRPDEEYAVACTHEALCRIRKPFREQVKPFEAVYLAKHLFYTLKSSNNL